MTAVAIGLWGIVLAVLIGSMIVGGHLIRVADALEAQNRHYGIGQAEPESTQGGPAG